MRLKHYLLSTAFMAVLVFALVVAPDVLAQNFGLDAAAGKSIPKTKDIAVIIGRILGVALMFVGTLFLLLMVYAGFLWMTARGDAKKVDTAKQLITGAIIGIIIIGSAYAITAWVLTAATGTNMVTSGGEDSGDGGGDASESKLDAGATCSSDAECTSGTCEMNTGNCSNEADRFCFSDSDCPTGGTCEGVSSVCL